VRITQPINEANLIPLKGNTHPLVQARFDRGPVPESSPTGHIMLVLQRSAAQEASLKEYLASLQDESSSNYHRWLTPAQFGASFGVASLDLETIEQWLQGHGFKVEGVPQGRNIIQFSGTMGQLEGAFHTSIHVYEINGEHHFANVSDPKIPAALAPVVLGVAHLNDFHPTSLSQPSAIGIYDASTKSIKPQFTLFNGTTPYLYSIPPMPQPFTTPRTLN
jgi:subtilase family serine protease